MIFRSFFFTQKHKKIHLIAAGLIALAVCINLFYLGSYSVGPMMFSYSLMCILCSILDVTSHVVKEHIVRTQ